jgi:crotonobetainyl-CoA:carnitine CoA-transferase CaiB-like acyl-CoA transferase
MMSAFGMYGAGLFSLERGTNSLDSGAHYYEVYECADGEWISVAPVEERFYAELLRIVGVSSEAIGKQRDTANWPRGKELLASAFRTKTRDEWCKLLEGTDACFAPVLSMAEAPHHAHNKAREAFVEVGGVMQPAPAPRFSRTPPGKPTPPEAPDADAALEGWLAPEDILALKSSGVL